MWTRCERRTEVSGWRFDKASSKRLRSQRLDRGDDLAADRLDGRDVGHVAQRAVHLVKPQGCVLAQSCEQLAGLLAALAGVEVGDHRLLDGVVVAAEAGAV